MTVEDGLICGAYETRTDAKKGKISICVKGKGRAEIFRIMKPFNDYLNRALAGFQMPER